jgi:predicted RNA methylase
MAEVKVRLDRFDTPASVSKKMVGAVVSRSQSVIADFAVGGGALLCAATERWPETKIVGADISPEAISALRRQHSDWNLVCVDFLDREGWSKSNLLESVTQKASLILLNPPFSCRGAKTFSVRYRDGERISCSLAIAFLINSLEFLEKGGEVVAVLPAGVLQSERDREAIRKLRATFSFDIVEEYGTRIFNGCSVRTFVAHIVSGKQGGEEALLVEGRTSVRMGSKVSLMRGGIQMHSAEHCEDRAGLPLIHTTEMVNNKLLPSRIFISRGASVCGPMILLPRVGEPKQSKIVIIENEQRFVLSDCVVAIISEGRGTLSEIYCYIIDNWLTFSRLYGGTCARYLTLRSLSHFLSSIGYAVDVARGIQFTQVSLGMAGGPERGAAQIANA